MDNNKKNASFATMISNIGSINQFLGMFQRDKLIQSAKIDFDTNQIGEIIYQNMILKKELKNQECEVKVEYILGMDSESQIKVTVKEKGINNIIKYLPVFHIEELLYQSMVKAKELSPTAYNMELKFELSNNEKSGVVDNIQVTATLQEPHKKMKIK